MSNNDESALPSPDEPEDNKEDSQEPAPDAFEKPEESSSLPNMTEGSEVAEDKEGSEDTVEVPHAIRQAASGEQTKKIDMGFPIPPIDVDRLIVRKARAVFIPSIHYLEKVDTITPEQRIWVISGSIQSGKFTTALHLGLALLQQGRPLDRTLYEPSGAEKNIRRPDEYARGIRLLRQRLFDRRTRGEGMLEDAAIEELGGLEARLLDNLNNIDDENVRADRYRTLAELSRRSLDLFNIPFHDLCRWTELDGNGADIVSPSQTLPRVKILRQYGKDSLALIDLLQDPQIESQTIYIIEQAFESGLTLNELTPLLRKSLAHKNCYLILTTELSESLFRDRGIPYISTRFPHGGEKLRIFLQAVLVAHLDYYTTVESLSDPIRVQVEKACEELLRDALHHPFTIDMFCARLRELPSEANREVVVKLADEVGRIDREATRTWFQGLSENERLYALLVYLFSGVDRYLLDDIYTVATRRLRQDGVIGLHDPRESGLSDIRDRVRAHVTEANTVQFNNRALVDETRRQVANYHHVLWSLCEVVFIDLIRQNHLAAAARFRQSLGAAIGRLGVYHLLKLQPLLDALAASESSGVAATAGYILDGLVRTEPSLCSWITELIDHWAKSQDPDRMWTACAAIWRIYDSIAELAAGDAEASHTQLASDTLVKLRHSLTEVATYPDRFNEVVRSRAVQRADEEAYAAFPDAPNADANVQAQIEVARQALHKTVLQVQMQQWVAALVKAVHHALIQIARQHSDTVVTLVESWLQDPPDSNQHVVAELAVGQLFGDTVAGQSQKVARLIAERHEPLLRLVAPMLGANTDAIRELLSFLRHWIQQEGWAPRVQQALLDTAARVSPMDRVHLASLIAEEWANDDEAVARVAQQVVARSRHIDGIPADVPGGKGALILVDSTRPARRQRALGARLARQISLDLASIAPPSLGSLGFAQSLTFDNKQSPHSVLAPTETPRLVIPVIEARAGHDQLLVLLLTWGPIIDLDDLQEGPWSEKVLVGVLSQTMELPEKVAHVTTANVQSHHQLVSTISSTATDQMVRALAYRDATSWWQRVGPLLGLENPDLQAVDRKFEEWLALLRDQSALPMEDPLRAIMATCCWLANADIDACVARLNQWLSSDDDSCRLAGGSAARALFYLFGNAPTIPSLSTHEVLLKLVVPLAAQGWPSACAILFAARRWIREPTWLDRLLDPPEGTSAEILRLVDDLSVEDRRHLMNFLESWDTPLPGDDPDRTPGNLKRLREQLALRVALGSGRPLPPLTDGQSYGVIVVDTSIARRPLQRSLAQIASAAVQEIRKKYNDGSIQLLLFRLGQQIPLSGPTERPTADVIAPKDSILSPRLLGPLLNRLPVEQVRFVVLISPTPAHDEEDWYEPPWVERLHTYREVDQETLPIGVIPTQTTIRVAGEAIAEYLETRIPRAR
jgi:hypothetical protein